MELKIFVCLTVIILSPLNVCTSSVLGQGLKPIQSHRAANQAPQQNTPHQRSTPNTSGQQAKPFAPFDAPYRLTSRIHLEKGANTGYLVFRVELKKGSHLYSLTQTGDIPPAKIVVENSLTFQLAGKFSPDRPPAVTEMDPVFGHRVEKHTGVVQFFAPIEIANGTDAETLAVSIAFDGLVCSDDNVCTRVSEPKIVAKFSGYFERTANRQTNSPNATRAK